MKEDEECWWDRGWEDVEGGYMDRKDVSLDDHGDKGNDSECEQQGEEESEGEAFPVPVPLCHLMWVLNTYCRLL